MTREELIRTARELVGEYQLSNSDFLAASVASALLTTEGNVYTGINIDVACGIGFCAEHSAVSEMLKHRETEIEMIVATRSDIVIPPCGRCRELMYQVDVKNLNTKVLVSEDQWMTLDELLPMRWEPCIYQTDPD